MREIEFDFNNMMSFAVGPADGVTQRELSGIARPAARARAHLEALIRHAQNRLGLGLEWAVLPLDHEKLAARAQELGAVIARQYKQVIFLGIGGSYLGLKAASDALCPAYYNEFSSGRAGRPKIYFEGNNLDPLPLGVLLRNLEPKKTFVVVISKSGETTETKAVFAVVEEWLKKGAGPRYGRQVAVITDPVSGFLRKRAEAEQKKDILSFRSLPLLKGVGGRFSEFNMGLLHLAVAGINIREVLAGARSMSALCRQASVYKNPALMYAALHYLLYKKKGKTIGVLMPFSESLKSTAEWYCQLLAESLGKKYARQISVSRGGLEEWRPDPGRVVHAGRTPVASRGTTDLHSIQQNNVEGENNKTITMVRLNHFRGDLKVPSSGGILAGKSVSGLLSLAQEATRWALVRAGRPNCTITARELTPAVWGGLVFFFEMATAYEGELLNVNAFDQPGVESYKNYMYYRLGKEGLSGDIKSEIAAHPLKKERKFIL